jgi:hypothetical protein
MTGGEAPVFWTIETRIFPTTRPPSSRHRRCVLLSKSDAIAEAFNGFKIVTPEYALMIVVRRQRWYVVTDAARLGRRRR